MPISGNVTITLFNGFNPYLFAALCISHRFLFSLTSEITLNPNWFVFSNNSELTQSNSDFSENKINIETRVNNTKKIYNSTSPTLVQLDKIDFSVGNTELVYNLGNYINKSGKDINVKVEISLDIIDNSEYKFDLRLNSTIVYQANCQSNYSNTLYKTLVPNQMLRFYITKLNQDITFMPGCFRITVTKL